MDNAKIKEAFEFLSKQELVGWDKNFVESVTDWFERHDTLSEKQYAILARIVEKFSPENLQAKEESLHAISLSSSISSYVSSVSLSF